jgi:hypothetical protein
LAAVGRAIRAFPVRGDTRTGILCARTRLVGGGTIGHSENMANSASAKDTDMTPGERALRDDGYRFVVPVDPSTAALMARAT